MGKTHLDVGETLGVAVDEYMRHDHRIDAINHGSNRKIGRDLFHGKDDLPDLWEGERPIG